MKGKWIYVKNLLEKSVKELVDERRKLSWELFSLKMKHSSKGLKETNKLKDLRRKISRINTILTSKIRENNGNNR